MPFLYKITCPDECFYIGKAKEPMKRFKQHYYNSYCAEDSFDWYIRKFKFEELKIEILKECSEETINKEENEAIVLAKYDLKTGKANPKNLNLMVNLSIINQLADLNPKDYWDMNFVNLKGTEYDYILHLAISFAKSKLTNKIINRHDDLILCSFCNRFYRGSEIHVRCSEESCKSIIDTYVKEFLYIDDKVQSKKNIKEYLKGFKEYRDNIQIDIDMQQQKINQWKANLNQFHTSVYDPKKKST